MSFKTIDELKSYATNISSSLLSLQLEALNIRNDNAYKVAHHLGISRGIIGLLKAIPKLNKDKNMVSNDLIVEAIELSIDSFTKARDLRSDVPDNAMPAFFSAALIEEYLQRLEASSFDVFNVMPSDLDDLEKRLLHYRQENIF